MTLAYGTHGCPLAYQYLDPKQVEGRLVYFRGLSSGRTSQGQVLYLGDHACQPGLRARLTCETVRHCDRLTWGRSV